MSMEKLQVLVSFAGKLHGPVRWSMFLAHMFNSFMYHADCIRLATECDHEIYILCNFLWDHFQTYLYWTFLTHTDFLKLPYNLWHIFWNTLYNYSSLVNSESISLSTNEPVKFVFLCWFDQTLFFSVVTNQHSNITGRTSFCLIKLTY
jgi:hypothetical protein